VRFTNTTQGTHPLSYSWDFGDGSGTSSLSDPYYTYTASGTYPVTLTVSSSLGSDSVTYPVVVLPCTQISSVSLELQSAGTLLLGEPVEFQAIVEPGGAHAPYSYSIDYGDGTVITGTSSDNPLQLSHVFNLPGDYQVRFSAWNCGMQDPHTDAALVNIYAEDAIAVSPLSDAATMSPGGTVTYTLHVTNTGPSSTAYNLELSDHAWETVLSTPVLGPLAPDQGQDFTVRVQVPEIAGGGQSDTVTVTVSAQSPGIIPVSAQLTTTAANVYALNFEPAESSQIGLPGGMVTYISVLSNTGNISDTYSIQIDHSWPLQFSVTPQEYYQNGLLTLDRGRSATLQAVVSIPADRVSGDSDMLTITATSSGDPSISELVRMETTAIAYNVQLPLIPAQ
jgi:PKD repeat protein